MENRQKEVDAMPVHKSVEKGEKKTMSSDYILITENLTKR